MSAQSVDAATMESTLRSELRTFAGQPSPRFIAAVLAVVVIARLAAGGYAWADLVVASVILGLEPFTEWVIHVFVLHAKPRRVLGREVDSLMARKHRRHHADPRDIPLVFVPLRVVVPGLTALVVLVPLLAPDRALALTGLVTGVAMLFVYEWTHFLIHTRYRPKSRYYRSIHRAHRLHHFRNEGYWFGVTIHLADHVLGTFPAKDEVEASPTARTLGVGG
ncbi:MAG: hypothetical protein QOH64_2983 [Acidimicrobiaceae bacterium]